MTAAVPNSIGCAATMARPLVAAILGNSRMAAPSVSHTQQAGARYMRPSMGWNLRPVSSHCVMTRRMASPVSDANMNSRPTMDRLTSPYAASAVPPAVSSTDAIILCVGSSRRARNRQIMVMTGVNALSIWMNATVRYRYTSLPVHRVRPMKKPTGRIFCTQYSLVMGVLASTTLITRQHTKESRPDANMPMPATVMGYLNLRSTMRCLFSRISALDTNIHDVTASTAASTRHTAGDIMMNLNLLPRLQLRCGVPTKGLVSSARSES
mmetsp:Transcript_37463/g.94549  ORF Transcript_37463/g.94549 Transcript_37463/m.94549 type:complete len:267 (+) Transcript_37463:751-1551(+)